VELEHRLYFEAVNPELRGVVTDGTERHRLSTKAADALVAAAQIDMLLKNRYLPGYLLAELNHYPERAEQLLSTMSGTTPANVRARLFGTLGKQLEDAARSGLLREIRPQEFVLNLVSMIVYPFAARPLVMAIMGMDDATFTAAMEERKKEIPAFFLSALRP